MNIVRNWFKVFGIIALVAVIGLSMTGCPQEPAPAPAPPPVVPAPPPPPPPAPPVGPPTFLVGSWHNAHGNTLVFTSGGAWGRNWQGNEYQRGTFTVSGSTIEILVTHVGDNSVVRTPVSGSFLQSGNNLVLASLTIEGTSWDGTWSPGAGAAPPPAPANPFIGTWMFSHVAYWGTWSLNLTITNTAWQITETATDFIWGGTETASDSGSFTHSGNVGSLIGGNTVFTSATATISGTTLVLNLYGQHLTFTRQ